MGYAAAAAYETVTPDFALDTLSAHFLNGPKPDQPLQQKVQRLSDGGRFCTRVVTVEQGGTVMVHATCSFVRAASMMGPSMKHCVSRSSNQMIEKIILDDLEPGRTRLGPFMKFQRLPLEYKGRFLYPDKLIVCGEDHAHLLNHAGPEAGPDPENPSPQSYIFTSVAQISPPITSSQRRHQALGIISLSDYHILGCPPTVHKLPVGLPAINDTSRTPLPASFERNTSLNHRVQFHVHDGFRADDLVYIEVMSPWTNSRRAEIQSRIFSKDGTLIATCVQEAYYVMKDDKAKSQITGGSGVSKL